MCEVFHLPVLVYIVCSCVCVLVHAIVCYFLQDQIERIQSQMHEMETITPEFISTAEHVAGSTQDEGEEPNEQALEQLDLLSHEWATKVSRQLYNCMICTCTYYC